MRLGLWISGAVTPEQQLHISDLLSTQDIPLGGFTEDSAASFSGSEDRFTFLYRIGEAILRGDAIPAALLERHLGGDAAPGNVLRRYLEWQENLALTLTEVNAPVPDNGCFHLGEKLLVCPLNPEGAADALLPPGQWTDIVTGEVVSGHFRRMRSPNALPILAAENAIIVTGDAACPTLHWYQAPPDVLGVMHREPYHLILHRDGEEICLR